ncbi:MAG: penicillin-binding protein 2 [bacterium]
MRQAQTISRPRPRSLPDLKRFEARGRLVMVFCLLFLFFTGGRLIWVNMKYKDKINGLKCFQHLREGAIPASRGRIFDCNNLPIVDNGIENALFVNPSFVPEESRAELAVALAQFIGTDSVSVLSILDSNSTYRELIGSMTPEQVQQFNAMKTSPQSTELLREVGIKSKEIRIYPNGPMAGSFFGFVSWRDKGTVGIWGLENRYDDVLAGRPGLYRDLRDQRSNRIPGSRTVLREPRPGTDLYTTIDANAQILAENWLREGMKITGAKDGIVIITEPSTGKIRALVSLPSVNPADYKKIFADAECEPSGDEIIDIDENILTQEEIRDEMLFSRATSLSYEPGSIMKIFTFSSAVEDDVISPTETFNVTKGPLKFRGGYVPDHDYKYGPIINLENAVVHSSNRAAALTAIKLGDERLKWWLRNFGFGQKTPLNWPGEPAGDLKDWLNPFPEIDLADMGFGHGLTASPLQIVQAASVFPNDGILVPLKLFRARRDSSLSEPLDLPSETPRRVLSPDTVEIMEGFMIGVVEEGTAMQAKTMWTCSGKTGTAQKINPEGGYYDNKFYSTFIGYGPIPDPKWLILVTLDEPKYPYFGGAACGPVFKAIFTGLMVREYGLPEKENDQSESSIRDLSAEDFRNQFETEKSSVSGEYVISSNPFAIPKSGEMHE